MLAGKQNPRHNNNRNRIRHRQATVQGVSRSGPKRSGGEKRGATGVLGEDTLKGVNCDASSSKGIRFRSSSELKSPDLFQAPRPLPLKEELLELKRREIKFLHPPLLLLFLFLFRTQDPGLRSQCSAPPRQWGALFTPRDQATQGREWVLDWKLLPSGLRLRRMLNVAIPLPADSRGCLGAGMGGHGG